MKYLKHYSGKAVKPSSCYLVLYTLNCSKEMKYLKLYSGKAVNPSSCYLVLYTLNCKKQSLFIEFHEEKLLKKKKAKLAKVSHWQSFSTSSICLQFQNQNEHKN